MDHYAADVADLVKQLDLHDASTSAIPPAAVKSSIMSRGRKKGASPKR